VKHSPLIGLLVLLFAVAHAAPAYAYLDPGTGSMILQTVVAGVLGATFAIKMYWQRIMTWFRSRNNKPSETE